MWIQSSLLNVKMRVRSNSAGFVLDKIKQAERKLSLVNDSRGDLEIGLLDRALVELRKIRNKYIEKASKLQKFQRRRLTSNHVAIEQDKTSRQLEKMGEIAAWFCIAFVIFVCLLAEIELHGRN